MALTTLAQIKIALKIATTTEDAYLSQMQGGVETALKRMLDLQIERATYTEYYEGKNTKFLVLRQTPVYSVTAIWTDPDGNWGQNQTPFADDPLSPYVYYLQKDGPGSVYSGSGIVVRTDSLWTGIIERPPGRLASKWTDGEGNIKVTYVAGWDVIPNDIQMAVWESVGALRHLQKFGYFGPVVAEGLSASSYSLGKIEELMYMLGTVREVLSYYKVPPV